MLTNRPGGWGDLEMSCETGVAVSLPWDRAKRVTLAMEPSASPLSRFWQLTGRPDYEVLRSVLGLYVDQTIPDPVLTAQGQWTITALPATGRTKTWSRLLTFNCGPIETLFIGDVTLDGGEVLTVANLNISAETNRRELGRTLRDMASPVHLRPNFYRASPVMTLEFDDLESLAAALTQPFVQEAAYALNVALMRQGSRVFSRFHNAPFATDILRAAREQSRELASDRGI
jgi:hypothetical protein